jgi:hypothetical protein
LAIANASAQIGWQLSQVQQYFTQRGERTGAFQGRVFYSFHTPAYNVRIGFDADGTAFKAEIQNGAHGVVYQESESTLSANLGSISSLAAIPPKSSKDSAALSIAALMAGTGCWRKMLQKTD